MLNDILYNLLFVYDVHYCTICYLCTTAKFKYWAIYFVRIERLLCATAFNT